MNVSGKKCPNCGATLDNIDDGRINFFCSYCGSSLSAEYSSDETEVIVRIKAVEAKLNNSRASITNANARQLEAETESIRYRDSRQSNKSQRVSGLMLIFAGIVILVISILGFFYVLARGYINFESLETVALLLLFGLFVFAITLSVIIIGIMKVSIPTGEARKKMEEKIKNNEHKISRLRIEMDNQRRIVQESGITIVGARATQRRIASKKVKEIAGEISRLEATNQSLESRLEGDL